MVATRRVVSWLANHGYDAAETIVAVLTSLPEGGRWTDSAALMNGEVADEYVVSWEEDDWYVKLYVDDDRVIVNVWSCGWDGAVH